MLLVYLCEKTNYVCGEDFLFRRQE